MLQLKKGINLESLQQPIRSAIATAAAIGADGIEINARTQFRPVEMSRTAVRHLQKTLADHNLKIAAVHFPTRRGYGETDALEQRIEATKAAMTMAFELGCNVVVNRIGRIPDIDTDQWNTLTQALTDMGTHGQRCGAYFAAQTGINSGQQLAQLIERLPALALKIDFDPAELLLHHHDIVESMEAIAEHVAHFRARDAVEDLSLGKRVGVQLGRGSVDWPALLGRLEEKGYSGYLTVHPESDANAVQQSTESMAYLTELFS